MTDPTAEAVARLEQMIAGSSETIWGDFDPQTAATILAALADAQAALAAREGECARLRATLRQIAGKARAALAPEAGNG